MFTRIRDLPDREGFAGAFAGVCGGALIVAGGANFPDKRPWDGGKKAWYDNIFVLDKPNGQWRSGFKLPRPNAYGVSITTSNGLACIGGGSATEHYNECFLLRWDGERIVSRALPNLPRPCAFMAGACAADTIYVAGGMERPNANVALKTFWALKLNDSNATWHELPSWPGPGRILAASGALGDVFYLFSGAGLSPQSDGKTARTYFKDAYSYSRNNGWTRLTDLPRPAVGAPSPALAEGERRIAIIGGDDGANVSFTPEKDHPGFPRTILEYDVVNGRWNQRAGQFSLATTPAVLWQHHLVLPSGEIKPGYRTPAVWWADSRSF